MELWSDFAARLMQTITGNIKYVEYITPYLVEYMYDDFGIGFHAFTKYLYDFKQILMQFSPEDQEGFLAGLKKAVIVLLNHPLDFSLNQWICDNCGYYLKDDQEALQLIGSIGDYFFPGEILKQESDTNENYELINEEIPY